MMIRALYPVIDQNGDIIAILDAGVLLNGNFTFVDVIRDLVYGPGSLIKGSIGTVTVFLDDVRITTSSEGPVPDDCIRVSPGLGTVDACEIDRSDENLPRLPEEIYFLAVQYNWESEFGTVIPMVSYSYRKNLDNCFDRSSCLSGIYEVDQEDVSARLTWLSPDATMRVTAYGNNLTDERFVTGGTPLVDVTETAGTIYNIPRMYGVEFAYNF